ncbi:hypothetical protein CN918_32615 [Priestia megaterium]|nr:hypothetical protein CN918_32615 [Priestia megaterium]
MTEEIWKAVKGYEGLYEVSDLGRVRRLPGLVPRRNGGFKEVAGRMMKISLTPNGYSRVHLSKNNKVKIALVHRLVAESFIPESTGHYYLNQKDGDRSNPKLSNLEWVPYANNHLYSNK